MLCQGDSFLKMEFVKNNRSWGRSADSAVGRPTALADPDSVVSTHKIAYSRLSFTFWGSRSPPLASEGSAHVWCTDIQAGKTPVHTT